MSRSPTKAEQILSGASQRVIAARSEVAEAEARLLAAQAAVVAHTEAYDALVKALAPKPRKKTAKPPAAQEPLTLVPPDPPGADDDKGPLCGICGNTEGYQDHFKPSPNYHAFEQPKVKKAVGSTQK